MSDTEARAASGTNATLKETRSGFWESLPFVLRVRARVEVGREMNEPTGGRTYGQRAHIDRVG